MLNVSAEWKRKVYFEDDRNYLAFVEITTTDNKKISLNNSNLWENGFQIIDSTSIENEFTLGSLVSSKHIIKLNNIYEEYSEYDFSKASVSSYIGKQLDNGLEKIKIGEFTVDETSYDGSVITLECLDNINKFNKKYSTSLSFPTTAFDIVYDACSSCDVPFLLGRFDNSDLVINSKPETDMTFGQVIAYILQMCGLWGKCDENGCLILKWYDMTQFDTEIYSGGTFSTKTTPYSDGDNVEGGLFEDYSSGDNVDGGNFLKDKNYHSLYNEKSFNVATDDVIITGIKVTISSDSEEDEDYEYLAGNEGYVISIDNNPLLDKNNANNVADYLYLKIGGMRFRPFNGVFLSDPTIEAGDVALIADRKRNYYNAFISNRNFSLGNSTSISCDAESALRNASEKFSAMTKVVVEARKNTQKQISSYDKQVQILTQLMSQSLGLFKTEQKQADGSVVYIMHNKQDLASSKIQWKMTANGFAVSSNYGQTWNSGIDSNGNSVFNVMSALGINFDWARGGTLSLGNTNNEYGELVVYSNSGRTIAKINKNGFYLNGDYFSVHTSNFECDDNGALIKGDIDAKNIRFFDTLGICKTTEYTGTSKAEIISLQPNGNETRTQIEYELVLGVDRDIEIGRESGSYGDKVSYLTKNILIPGSLSVSGEILSGTNPYKDIGSGWKRRALGGGIYEYLYQGTIGNETFSPYGNLFYRKTTISIPSSYSIKSIIGFSANLYSNSGLYFASMQSYTSNSISLYIGSASEEAENPTLNLRIVVNA